MKIKILLSILYTDAKSYLSLILLGVLLIAFLVPAILFDMLVKQKFIPDLLHKILLEIEYDNLKHNSDAL